jgi:hypothetical protein
VLRHTPCIYTIADLRLVTDSIVCGKIPRVQ